MADATTESLSIPCHGTVVKVLGSAVLLGVCAFLLSMAVLVAMSSELKCGRDAQCAHVERYPFGIVRQEALPRITGADTEWSPGGREMAIKLVVHHEDGSVSEYQGVGTNGERAQRVAKELEEFLAHPAEGRTFPLREGSVPVAVFMALLGLLMLVFLPFSFSTVSLAKAGDHVELAISRWPAPPRRYSVATGDLRGFGLRRTAAMNQEIFTVWAERARIEDGIDLGLGFRSESRGQQRVGELNQWLGR